MANSYLNYARTTSGYAVLLRAFSIARRGTSASQRPFSTDETGANNRVADIFNEVHFWLTSELPAYNVSVTTMAMLAGVRTSTIPSTLRDQSILSLRYDDDDGIAEQSEIMLVPYRDILARSPEWVNGTFVESYPRFACITNDDQSAASRLSWFGLPSANRTVVLNYQVTQAAYTYAELINAASTKYVFVPDVMAEMMAHFVAAGLIANHNGRGTQEELQLLDWANSKLLYWQTKMPVAQELNARVGMLGYAPSAEQSKLSPFSRTGTGRGRY